MNELDLTLFYKLNRKWMSEITLNLLSSISFKQIGFKPQKYTPVSGNFSHWTTLPNLILVFYIEKKPIYSHPNFEILDAH